MTVNYTTNLALGQPVTGTESGTWGDDVNNSVTSYLDIAIAGGLAVTVTTTDVTLTNTQGTSSATNIGSTTAQYAILNISGAMTGARNLIVPSSSKSYIIYNNTTGGYTLTVKGSATTGVGLVNGEKAIVAWNGSDYIKISSSVITNLTGTLPVGNGGTGITTTPANGQIPIGNGTNYTAANLTAGSGVSITNSSGGITIAATGSGGTVTSVAASVPAFLSITGSPITTSGTLAISYSGTALPVANGGTGSTTLTANNVLLGNGTSALQVVAPGATGNVLTSNGTTWSSTAPSGGGGAQGFVTMATGINRPPGGFILSDSFALI